MKNYLKNYIKEIDHLLNNKQTDFQKLKEEHLIKIQFFQHERLIHLIVTLFYALFLILFLFLSKIHSLYIIPTLILIVFLIFYVKHYFFLENSVQYLYKQYDIMNKYFNK